MIPLSEFTLTSGPIELRLSINGIDPLAERDAVDLTAFPSAAKATGRAALHVSEMPRLVVDLEADLFQPLQLMENCEYDFYVLVPLTLRQYLVERRGARPAYPFVSDSLMNVITFNSVDAFSESDGWLKITGRLNFRDRAGIADLSVETGGNSLPLMVEVLTSKLSYREEYRALLESLADYSASLLLRLDTAVEATLSLTESEHVSPLVELLHIRRLFRNGSLLQHLLRIENNSALRVAERKETEETAFCPEPDYLDLASDPASAGWIRREGTGFSFLPLRVPFTERYRTHDTPENRFVKYITETIARRLDDLTETLPPAYLGSRAAVTRWADELRERLAAPFWREVRSEPQYPNSMLLLQRSGYRELTEDVTAMSLGIALESGSGVTSTMGELKPVYDLFEMWCFLQVYHALEELTGNEGTPGIDLVMAERAYVFSFQKNHQSPIRFTYSIPPMEKIEDTTGLPTNNENMVASSEAMEATSQGSDSTKGTSGSLKIELYYNRIFRRVTTSSDVWSGSYSGPLKPDVSIRISDTGGRSHWIHFDAKYRLNRFLFRQQLEQDEETSPEKFGTIYKREDLHIMHTYRDALLGTRGSYVLYPGQNEKADLYVRHPSADYRNENALPSVGAFPLSPGESGRARQLAELVEFLRLVCTVVAHAQGYSEEQGVLGYPAANVTP